MSRIQVLITPLASLLMVCCLVGAVIAGTGYRLEWWGLKTGFTVLKWSVYLVSVPVLLVMISMVWAKLKGDALVGYRHLVLLVIALVVFGVPYQLRQEFRQLPTIADATTNFVDPPEFVELVAVREKTARNPLLYRGGDATALQKEHFPNLTSLQLDVSAEEVIAQAVSVVNEMGMELIAANPQQGYLEATATSFWFGFKDDLIVRAQSLDNGKTQVDVRSASRVGYLDGGVNAKRVEEVVERLGG